MTQKQRIKSRTSKRAAETRRYNARVKEWLLEPNNMRCRVSQHLNMPRRRATQCHHTRGRIGRLLLLENFWCPVSQWGHDWIHRNPNEARRMGFLCEAGQFNTIPKDTDEL